MREHKLRSLLAPMLAAALVVGACQPSAPDAGPARQTQQVTDEPDPNGELITNLGAEPDTIDPHRASFVHEISVIMTVFDGLMTLDPKTFKAVPNVAANEPEISADGKTWKFTLRDGVKFSDGTPVTARDYARGFTRTCDPATHGEYTFVLYVVEGCQAWYEMDPTKAKPEELRAARNRLGVKALDDKTIEFKLIEPAAYFGSIAYMWVGMPVKQDSLDKGGDRWTEPATYIGNGPFKLVEWKHNERMVFERNEHYWKGVPKLKRWTRLMINEGATYFAAYQNDEVDVYGIAAEDLRTIEANPELKKQMVDIPGSCTFYVGFNTTKPPLDDVKVRQAFSKAFDRRSYISDVQRLGAPATGGFIPPGFPGHDPDDKAQAFDAAAAKKLLSESKYSGRPELQNVKFTYSANARTKTRVEFLQQQFKASLGVTLIADPVDSTVYTQLVKKQETLPLMFILGWCADYFHQQNWLTTVFHSSASSLGRTGWKNAEFDKLVKQGDVETSKDKADQLYLQASRILSQEAPAAWLYYSGGPLLLKPYVRGVTFTPLDAALGQLRLHEIYVTKRR